MLLPCARQHSAPRALECTPAHDALLLGNSHCHVREYAPCRQPKFTAKNCGGTHVYPRACHCVDPNLYQAAGAVDLVGGRAYTQTRALSLLRAPLPQTLHMKTARVDNGSYASTLAAVHCIGVSR